MMKPPYDQPASTGRWRSNAEITAATSSARLRVVVVLVVQWLLGHAMSPVVQGYQAELLRQWPLVLVMPGQVALRPAVDQ